MYAQANLYNKTSTLNRMMDAGDDNEEDCISDEEHTETTAERDRARLAHSIVVEKKKKLLQDDDSSSSSKVVAVPRSNKKQKTVQRPPPAWFLSPPESRPVEKTWTAQRPIGLYTKNDVISDATHATLLTYFGSVDWVQRWGRQYPHTAHYNYMHTKTEATDPDELQTELATKYPELCAAGQETLDSMKSIMPPGTAFDTFAMESFAVHKHKAADGKRLSGGLGAHYDNAHHVGQGLVMMLNVVAEDATKAVQVHREFLFTDPPGGRKFSLSTPGKMGLVFTGNAYDFWKVCARAHSVMRFLQKTSPNSYLAFRPAQHESVRSKKQTVTCYSITIRLKRVCGYGKTAADNLEYAPGAGPAERVAHQRIKAILDRGEAY